MMLRSESIAESVDNETVAYFNGRCPFASACTSFLAMCQSFAPTASAM